MATSSIRFRLMIMAAISLAVTLTLAGVVLMLTFERHIERRVAQELEAKLSDLASAFDLADTGRPILVRELGDPRYAKPYSGVYWQVSNASGSMLRSRSLWDDELKRPPARSGTSEAMATEMRGPGGSLLYALGRTVTMMSKTGEVSFDLMVGLDHAEVEALSDSFAGDLMVALGAMAGLLMLGAWVQLSVGLAPLAHLRAGLERIRSGRERRLEGAFPNEVQPLAHDLNGLLDRHDNSIRKARDRAGTLAHGLKTPLAIVAAEARKLEKRGLREEAQTLREQIDLMNGHIQRELSRARTYGSMVAGGAMTNANLTANRLLGLLVRMPRGDEIAWISDIPPALRIHIDPDDFGEILGNLLDNARKWAKTRVQVTAAIDGARVVISVADDGPGIPADRHADAIERGGRISGDGEGTGLGLAIVSDVLEAYQSELVLGQSALGGLLVSFSVPGWLDGAASERAETAAGEAPAPHSGGAILSSSGA